jgi:hypothetical protein
VARTFFGKGTHFAVYLSLRDRAAFVYQVTKKTEVDNTSAPAKLIIEFSSHP